MDVLSSARSGRDFIGPTGSSWIGTETPDGLRLGLWVCDAVR